MREMFGAKGVDVNEEHVTQRTFSARLWVV
jgi:hypothetical protein